MLKNPLRIRVKVNEYKYIFLKNIYFYKNIFRPKLRINYWTKINVELFRINCVMHFI